jgi:hypothetical protein
MSLIDRVHRARSRVMIEAALIVVQHPGAFPALELSMRELRESETAKAQRKADLHSAIRAVEPDRNPPGHP